MLYQQQLYISKIAPLSSPVSLSWQNVLLFVMDMELIWQCFAASQSKLSGITLLFRENLSL